MNRQLEVCPICRRIIPVSNHSVAMTHSDKSGSLCPFSGQPLAGAA